MPESEGVGDHRVGLKDGEICRLPTAEKDEVLKRGAKKWEAGEVAAGIAEGDYTSWTWKWTNAIPDGLDDYTRISFFIDDKNDVLYLAWEDGDTPPRKRFGIYNLSDFSVVFESPSGLDYLALFPNQSYARFLKLGDVMLAEGGGLSRSLQRYVLLVREDEETIEVWRGGAIPLWSRNITLDTTGGTPYAGEISLTGKYIVVRSDADDLILYEGT